MIDIFCADAVVKLRDFEANIFDSLVTDPPAGINFMGKHWDKGDDFVDRMAYVYRECLRVMKPGAHGLIWAIPRTSHWTGTALEHAGFEIRDVVTHLFGSGFPKSLDISKAIDKMAGIALQHITVERQGGGFKSTPYRTSEMESGSTLKHMAATDEAKQWAGFGTALKPACEFWILVRKPISEKTIVKNVLKWGTGALNIDASRIDGVPSTTHKDGSYHTASQENGSLSFGAGLKALKQDVPSGRFPANLVLSHHPECELVGTKEVKPHNGSGVASKKSQASDAAFFGNGGKRENEVQDHSRETVEDWNCHPECAVKLLDEQSGVLKSGMLSPDNGGASRFFYIPKASKRDRGEGNKHPTVKNTKLMEYLITLITPPGGTVLDPFMGSGSTGVAATRKQFSFVGIEREQEYFDIAKQRITEFSNGKIKESKDGTGNT